MLINPDPHWLVLYRVLRFRETTQKALRARISRQIHPPSGMPGDPDTSRPIYMVNGSQLYGVNT